MSVENIKRVKSSEIELKDRLVAINRVAKVTKGGRTFSFAAIVVVGDENGVVGYGLGKANEVVNAIAKGIDDAKKNLIRVPVFKGTVPHEQYGKYSGGFVFIKPASHGTGVIAGGAMRAVLESAGVTDVLAKSKGSSNPHNVVKATIDALAKMRDPFTVADHRGVSLDKVVTQVKSVIDRSERQKRTVAALGIKKLNHSVVVEATPQVLGMVEKVSHLVKVEIA
jgi:small subunit ribosomal protein S5